MKERRMNKISMNELFSGIGAQRKALLNIGYDVDVVGIAEIDKYAIQSYEAIFGKTRNYGDISKVEKLDYADLWTYSFPCQDISVAGKQRGINENTRSGLLYQVQRLLEVAKEEGTLPKYLLLENVKALVGKKFKAQFDEWLQYLDGLGYKNYWQVLNAKDYGIPQNRERVFVVSIRQDVVCSYTFPKKEDLCIGIQDILEDEVEDKYYLNEKQVQKILHSTFAQEKTRIQTNNVCQTLLARDFKDPKVIVTKGTIIDDTQGFDGVRLYSNVSPTLGVGRHDLKTIADTVKNVRKLTPLEYWRLMGFDDEDFNKAKASGVSNTQLYKQAGNSIVVDVLERIFNNLH